MVDQQRSAFTRPQRRVSTASTKAGSERQQHIGIVLLLSTVVGAIAMQQGSTMFRANPAKSSDSIGQLDVNAPPQDTVADAVPTPSPGQFKGASSLPKGSAAPSQPGGPNSGAGAQPSSPPLGAGVDVNPKPTSSAGAPSAPPPAAPTQASTTNRVSVSTLSGSHLVANSAGLVMEVPSLSVVAGSQLEVNASDGGANQRWTVVPAENNTMRLRNGNSNMCVTLAGSNVVQHPCGGGEQRLQVWRTSGGGLILRFATTGVSMGTSGSRVVGASGDSWRLA